MELQIPTSECGIDELAGVLLRFCRDHAAALRAVDDDPHQLDHLTKWSLVFGRWFETEIDSDLLSAEEVGALRAKVEEIGSMLTVALADPRRAEVILARAAAEGLDDALGHRFMVPFRLRRRVQLREGDPFPVPQRPLKELFAGDLGTNPDRLAVRTDGLRHLRIVRSHDFGHEIWLSLEHEDALATLTAASRVAVLIPSDLGDLEWDVTQHDQHPTFHDVRPRDRARQTENVIGLLAEARGRADIVILPELCIDASGLDAVKSWYADQGEPFRVLVCGSVHVTPAGDGVRRNVSTTLLAGGGTIEHFKFNPFSLPLEDASGRRVLHREGIVTVPSRITLYLCARWSFTTLICKDFLEGDATRILEDLRPGLILVPACSPKSLPFETEAQHLALRAQALVVVANLTDGAPAEAVPVSAIFVKPLDEDPVEKVLRASLSPPAYHVFDVVAGGRGSGR